MENLLGFRKLTGENQRSQSKRCRFQGAIELGWNWALAQCVEDFVIFAGKKSSFDGARSSA